MLSSPRLSAACLLPQALCKAAGDVIDSTLSAVNKDPEDEPPLDMVASLYSDKTAGVCRGAQGKGARGDAGRCRVTRLWWEFSVGNEAGGLHCCLLLPSTPIDCAYLSPAAAQRMQARIGAWTPTLRRLGSRHSVATSPCWLSTPCWPSWAAWRSWLSWRWSRVALCHPRFAKGLAPVGFVCVALVRAIRMQGLQQWQCWLAPA